MLQAFRLGEEFAPLRNWEGAEPRLMAGRIAMNLGAPRLGRAIHARAFREHPDHPEVAYYYARGMLEIRGPLAAIEFCRESGKLFDGADDGIRADWIAMRAYLAATYRDFENADDLLAAAEALAPQRPWICVERSVVLELQDRCEEALAAARRSLEFAPWFRGGVQRAAHVLQLLDRDDEAHELLQEASSRIESAAVVGQLASLQDHLGRHGEALETLSRIDALIPLAEKGFNRSVAWVRSNTAYQGGRLAEAVAFAEQSGDEFMAAVAEELRPHVSAGSIPARVILDFPFVRQHHMTCAPATLSAISRFWGRDADHLALVEAICYDGTASFSQRRWAEENHWTVREFTVTREAAVALIDRGLPFTIATVQVTSAHLQAVVGYDPLRQTLLCRDPNQYYLTEISIKLLLKHNVAHGPRGMVMVPESHASRLDDLPLPDVELFDLLHAIEGSLARHDRAEADAARARIEASAPGHLLSHQARRALASYDIDPVATLEAVDEMLSLFPDDQPLLLARLQLLSSLDRRDLAIPLLEKMRLTKGAHPVFLQILADALLSESGNTDRAMTLLRNSLQRQPTDARSLSSMANVLWSRRRLEEATALYYLSACVDDKNESAAQIYFVASRHLRQTDQALAMLERRFERLGKRSSKPACTLFWALEALDRVSEAISLLDRARRLRPDDGDLLLFAVDAHGRGGELVKAHSLLELAETRTHPNQWRRSAARIAVYEGDLAGALSLWRKVLDAEPLADDANQEVAQLIAQTQSPADAARHLAEVQDRFPHNTNLHRMRIRWLRAQGAAAVVPVVRELVERRPSLVWARIELSLKLSELGHGDEALDHAKAALAIAPHASAAHNASGEALCCLQRIDEAQEAFRQAIRISVDFIAAVNNLVNSYAEADGKRQALSFVHDELVRQVVFGDGIVAYYEQASAVLEPPVLLVRLQEARAARPDLWQTWSTTIHHLTDANDLESAFSLARQAVDRFPLLPRVWFDLSEVCARRSDRAGQIHGLNKCLQLSPSWSMAARRLAQAKQNSGESAQLILERAISRDPLDALNHEAYARALWKAGDHAGAILRMRQALLLDPGLGTGWTAIKSWSNEQNSETALIEFARDVCRRRAGEAIGWLVLARMLSGAATLSERIEACNAAIARSPRNGEAYDLRACLLLEAGQISQAIEACNPTEYAGHPPVELRGRRAWITAQQGKLQEAIEEMAEVLRQNTTYYWGWRQLVLWQSKEESVEDYLQTARTAAALFVHDSTLQNYLASAQLKAGDQSGAAATLARAIELEPENWFALNALFDARIKNCELDAAAQTLGLIMQHTPRDYALSREVLLAAASGDRVAARDGLSGLCIELKEDAEFLIRAVEGMQAAGMRRDVDSAFDKGGANTAMSPVAVDVWARRAANDRSWSLCRKILRRFPDDSTQWKVAAIAYIDGLAQGKHAWLLSRLIRSRRDALRRHTRLWGAVGYAQFAMNDTRGCIRWQKDWNQRHDASPWMLLNLAGALHRIGRDEAANAVHRFALDRKSDQTTLKHTVWLAFDEAVTGQSGQHLKALGQADRATLDKHYPYLCELIEALRPLLSGPAPDARDKLRKARSQIVRAYMKVRRWPKQPELRRAFGHSIRRVASYHPSLYNRLWAIAWTVRALFTTTT